jgi:hypothetical protein
MWVAADANFPSNGDGMAEWSLSALSLYSIIEIKDPLYMLLLYLSDIRTTVHFQRF